MPLEIRELVVRAIISSGSEEEKTASSTNQSALSQEIIVKECVRQIMQILKKKGER